LAITVFGQIDVEARDETRAHLRIDDMCFIKDVKRGIGRPTRAPRASSCGFRKTST
jgi:hypothetical protein